MEEAEVTEWLRLNDVSFITHASGILRDRPGSSVTKRILIAAAVSMGIVAAALVVVALAS